MKDTVMVFTSKSLETMQAEGGSGDWKSDEERLKHMKWFVATRNQRSGWTQGDEEHGSAFLIGHVVDIKPSPSEPKRFVIAFDRYAEIHVPNAWTHDRNPVAYTNLETLGINPEELQWKPFTGKAVDCEFPAAHNYTASRVGDVIDQARAMIASSLQISPDAVKITIAL